MSTLTSTTASTLFPATPCVADRFVNAVIDGDTVELTIEHDDDTERELLEVMGCRPVAALSWLTPNGARALAVRLVRMASEVDGLYTDLAAYDRSKSSLDAAGAVSAAFDLLAASGRDPITVAVSLLDAHDRHQATPVA